MRRAQMMISEIHDDRKHIELDIDHIIEVITEELTHYSKDQMLNDFKHCQASIGIDQLNDLFQTKCKNCGGEDCPVLQRKTQKANDDDVPNDTVRTQRTSTLFRMDVDAIKLMNILDDDIQGELGKKRRNCHNHLHTIQMHVVLQRIVKQLPDMRQVS
eukprot:564275_1